MALYEHADTDALHVHAVIGAIDLETGKKMHGNWLEYREKLVNNTDEVVQEYGLKVTQVDPERYEKRSMAEIKLTDKGQTTWKDEIRQAVDSVMSNARISDFETFTDVLREKSIEVYERGKDVTYRLLGTNYKARGNKLGTAYEKGAIQNELENEPETSTQIPENQMQTELMTLNQTLTEIRNYQGTQIQLQSKQQIELTEQLSLIEKASQRVNQAFQTTLKDLESNKESSNEQLEATLNNAHEKFGKTTRNVNQRTIDELHEILNVQKENNKILKDLSENLNNQVQNTMDQLSKDLSRKINDTHTKMSWYTIKNYMYAVVPTGILSGLVFWLLTHFFA